MATVIAKLHHYSMYPFIASTLLGVIGAMVEQDPAKGFSMYAFTFIVVFIVLLNFF